MVSTLTRIFIQQICRTIVAGPFERSATLSKALENAESLSNGSRVKFEFDQTFVRLSFDFPF